MQLIRVIKIVSLLTIGNVVLSVTKKFPVSTRYDCRCGEMINKSVHRITGGKSSKTREFPWQALVESVITKIGNVTRYLCGGTIINSLYILTAAHCGYGYQEKTFEIFLGHSFKAKTRSPYKVVKIIVHERYGKDTGRSGFTHDIALFKVGRSINFNTLVKPICLPNEYDRIEGEIANVIGWGHSNWKKDNSKTCFLQETVVKVLSLPDCRKQLKGSMKDFDSSMICATGRKYDACMGDNGGPLYYKTKHGIEVQMGIVSFMVGRKCGTSPVYYAYVPKFLEWIYKNTKAVRYCYRQL